MAYTRFDKTLDMFIVSDSITCDRWSFEGKAADVKAYIDDIVAKAEAMGMVGEGRFDFEVTRGYYDDYEMNVVYDFDRAETDAEVKRRVDALEKEKARKAAERKKAAAKRKAEKDGEYELFLKLKAKFGDAA